ncbi:MAG: hypothetical protein D6722_12445 [Bacteroidetes bacterium]|nr:MAG: hypothetical protein D6722_12445 [Bacteroidota bacterium]
MIVYMIPGIGRTDGDAGVFRLICRARTRQGFGLFYLPKNLKIKPQKPFPAIWQPEKLCAY